MKKSIKEQLGDLILRDGLLTYENMKVYCDWKPCRNDTATRKLRELSKEGLCKPIFKKSYIIRWDLIQDTIID